eukprot:GHVN01103700.1.p1 GENE.GHVN01103700.1~~GHVN01103700.1.p1  ORF type:complete len:269 (+),score=39.42 GHVN01103700.1:133-939(+)
MTRDSAVVGASTVTSFDKLEKIAAGQLHIQSTASSGNSAIHIQQSPTHQVINALLVNHQRAYGTNPREVFKRILTLFPTATLAWKLYGEYEEQQGSVESAKVIYQQGVQLCPHVALWTSYIQFTKRTSPLSELHTRLQQSVKAVGCDHRASYLWRELIHLNVRIYNSFTCHGDGLLPDPTQSPATPLIPQSIAERELLCQLGRSRHESLAMLRQTYQQCLMVPLEISEHALIHYGLFEHSLSTVVGSAVAEYEAYVLRGKAVYTVSLG